VLDQIVVAGGQGDVLFWDRRTRKPLCAFDDMHMDDVTQVGGARAGAVLRCAVGDGGSLAVVSSGHVEALQMSFIC